LLLVVAAGLAAVSQCPICSREVLMAAPNIVSPTSITLKQISSTVGTAAITLVTCAADRAVKVSTLYAANVQGTNAGDITIRVSDGTATHAVCSTVSVPADASLLVVDRNSPVYLEEGDRIEAIASATGTIEIVGSFEEIA
jgi:hypothetical protein